MMQVQFKKISQEYPLEKGGLVRTMVSVKLKSGYEMELELTEAQLNAVLSESAQSSERDDTFSFVEPESDQEEVVEKASSDEPVRWSELSDDTLAPGMKALMVQLGVAPVVPLNDLIRLVDDISERMAAQEELTQGGAEEAPPVPAPAPVSSPKKVVGKLQLNPTPRRRTVPKDDAGNPIAPNMSAMRRPADDGDEDGVAQL